MLAGALLAQVVIRSSISLGSGEAKPLLPLINVDDEMAGHVKRATEMIAKGDYAGAIDILQALLNRREQCFVPTDDVRRFVPLWVKVNEVIGQMSPDGLTRYRREFDVQAQQIYRRAAETLDQGELRGLLGRYFHTSYGDKAENLLGAILFDRGEFSQAATCWHQILDQYRGSNLDKTALLAKIVLAHHLAGEQAAADRAAEDLARQAPEAKIAWGGQELGLPEFREKIKSLAAADVAARTTQEGWPSLSGSPDSVAVMPPCQPVLSPRWSSAEGKIEDNPNIRAVMGGLRGNPSGDPGYKPPTVALREGQVVLSYQFPGQGVVNLPMPCVLHPVVVDQLVLVREVEGVAAYDLVTGERIWGTFEFPLYRSVPLPGGYSYNPYPPNLEDRGNGTLTVAEGKVFAVGRFLPPGIPPNYGMGNPNIKVPPDTSVLEAFSLSGQGHRLWRLGDGEGGSDLLRGGRYMSAPTYAAGRLFVLVQYAQSFHLVCLDVDTGRLIWSVAVSQTPILNPNYGYYRVPGMGQGSPPAVADGKVVVVTNAGVAAAFEAESGRALWAYHYENVSGGPGPVAIRSSVGPAGQTPGYPSNPVVVARGRVIFLAADSRQLTALRADTGEMLWSVDRADQEHLTALDESRMILSENKLLMVDSATGRTVWPEKESPLANVIGRPAVTSEAVLVSGRGELIRVSLPQYAVSRLPLADPEAMLGNLLSTHGKLLTASAAGVSCYCTFEQAREELTQRLAVAAEEDQASLLLARAMNAFNSGRADEALGDLTEALKRAQADPNAGLVEQRVRTGLYRACVALGNKSDSDAVMLENFKQAQAYAYSPATHAEMLIRMMKYYAKVNQPARSAEIAQSLTVEYPDVQLADVAIGASADPFVRDDPYLKRRSGYDLGHDFIKQELIAKAGQDCYAAFDAKADAELKQAIAAVDPEAMVKVTGRYRYSVWAPMALLRAAETLYRKVSGAPADPRAGMLTTAGMHLGHIGREYPDSGLAASAALGRALVYQQLRPGAMVNRSLRVLEALPAGTRLAFADVSGSRDEILDRFAELRRARGPAAQPYADSVTAPLAKLYAGPETGVLLRDSRGEPIRSGDNLFLLQGNTLCMIDPTAADFERARKWEAKLLPVDFTRMYQFGYAGTSFSLCGQLSEDGKTLAFCSRGGFAGVDVRTGKLRWQRPASDSAIGSLWAMTGGKGQMVLLSQTGNIVGINVADGTEAWRQAIPQQQLQLRGPPMIRGELLLIGHGRTETQATIIDLNTKKSLGVIRMAQSNSPEFEMTEDGIVLGTDGKSLRCVEPMLSVDQAVWTIGLPGGRPFFLTATDNMVVMCPNLGASTIECRGINEDGSIGRTLDLENPAGAKLYPVRALEAEERLVVLTSTRPTNYGWNSRGRVIGCADPGVQMFDLASGNRLWSVELASEPKGYQITLMGLTRNYVAAVVKDNAITRAGTVWLIDRQTGRVSQKIELPGVQNMPQPSGFFMHMAMGAPVAVKDRLVVETLTGIEVYGKKASGDATTQPATRATNAP